MLKIFPEFVIVYPVEGSPLVPPVLIVFPTEEIVAPELLVILELVDL